MYDSIIPDLVWAQLIQFIPTKMGMAGGILVIINAFRCLRLHGESVPAIPIDSYTVYSHNNGAWLEVPVNTNFKNDLHLVNSFIRYT